MKKKRETTWVGDLFYFFLGCCTLNVYECLAFMNPIVCRNYSPAMHRLIVKHVARSDVDECFHLLMSLFISI